MNSSAASDRLPALDGLRGFAAYVVIVSHFSNKTGWLDKLLGEGAGQIGVMLFFVLSGFLMGRLYGGREWTGANIWDFARRRVARVVPLYLIVVILTYLARGTFFRGLRATAINNDNIWQHLLFWEGDYVFWTIPVEIQFYLIFPLLWLAGSLAGRFWFVPLAAVLAIFLFIDLPVYPVLLNYGAFFVTGTLIAGIKWRPGDVIANAIFALALASFIVLLPGISRALGIPFWRGYWHSPIYVVMAAALVWSAQYAPIAMAIFGNRVARFFGAISYSVYLLHLCVLHGFYGTPLRASEPLYLAVVLVLTTLIAYASFRLIERPLQTLIVKISAPRTQRATAAGRAG